MAHRNERIGRTTHYSDGTMHACEYRTMTGASMHLLHNLVNEGGYISVVQFTIPDFGQIWEVSAKLTSTIGDLCEAHPFYANERSSHLQ